jgi:hypothetical protein
VKSMMTRVAMALASLVSLALISGAGMRWW